MGTSMMRWFENANSHEEFKAAFRKMMATPYSAYEKGKMAQQEIRAMRFPRGRIAFMQSDPAAKCDNTALAAYRRGWCSFEVLKYIIARNNYLKPEWISDAALRDLISQGWLA